MDVIKDQTGSKRADNRSKTNFRGDPGQKQTEADCQRQQHSPRFQSSRTAQKLRHDEVAHSDRADQKDERFSGDKPDVNK